MVVMRIAEFVRFIKEREKVRVAKEAGKPWPWTKDEILQVYRFCNVRREDDAVTRWIADNWRTPHATDPDLWFAMVVARLFNKSATLGAIGYPVPWRPATVKRKLVELRTKGPIFNAAYIVSTNGKPGDKLNYLFDQVFAPLWSDRRFLRPHASETLARYHRQLMEYDGLGNFMAAQIIADMKYVAPLAHSEDWSTWAAPGPGSSRGLNRLYARPVGEPWGRAGEWLGALQRLGAVVAPMIAPLVLHMQDLQNCLCEFDKYERVRLGEGYPKQLYRAPPW